MNFSLLSAGEIVDAVFCRIQYGVGIDVLRGFVS